MKKLYYLSLSLFMLISVISCQKDRINVDLESISGPTWRLFSWEENKVDKNLYPNGLPFINFTKEGKISGSTGCNSYQATIELSGENILISDFSISYVGCPKDLAVTEDGNIIGLKNANKLFLEGNTLIFMQDDKVLLRFKK